MESLIKRSLINLFIHWHIVSILALDHSIPLSIRLSIGVKMMLRHLRLLTAQAHTNGTVMISNSSNLHTYLYKQNPEDGSQNTTLSFDINTGVLQSLSAGYGNYTLTASLYVPTTSTIPGFSIGLIFLSAVATVGIILRRKH